MGQVQSGKTSNYIGLICKAADAGYKVIIVLAGMHNNLRCQTQIRIEEGFLGFDTTPRPDGSLKPVGVGLENPGPKAHYLTRRFDPANPGNGDFQRSVANQSGVVLGGHPILFVVKKNGKVLENLIRWLKGRCDLTDPDTNRKSFRDLPLLLIDDESDQASIDISTPVQSEDESPDPDAMPSTINAKIRELLSLFQKSAYVGYTATPFANVFINEKAYSERFSDDLFPRSFIHSLPIAEGYTGAGRTFGLKPHIASDLEHTAGLPIFRSVSDHADSDDPRETNGWMPPRLLAGTGHIPRVNGEKRIPKSLEKAIVSFLISCAVRAYRTDKPHHNSMLIHVTRLQNVQDEVKKQVEEAFYAISNDLAYLDQSPAHDLVKELWNKDFLPTAESGAFTEPCPLPSLGELKRLLKMKVQDVKVKAIHGESDDILDYEKNRETGVSAIVIGGDKLSRGLTLEGLTTSYFLRSSKMYDTLMQMGRWFGYRAGYEDLCRIYTTDRLFDWFGHLAIASEELRKEFEFMEKVKESPINFGLKVLRHPSMMITSRTKLKTGSRIRFTFAGSRPQTLTFSLASEDLKNNYEALEKLVKTIGDPDEAKPVERPIWRNRVGTEAVISFLEDFRSHEKSRVLDPARIAKYIERMNAKDELTTWTVMISGKKRSNPLMIDNAVVGPITRTATRSYKDDPAFSIGVLTDPKDESSDLLKSELERARSLDKKEDKESDSDFPSPEAVREARSPERGLLMIYPIDLETSLQDREEFDKVEKSVPALGLSLSFPTTSAVGEIVEFQVNNVFDEQSN